MCPPRRTGPSSTPKRIATKTCCAARLARSASRAPRHPRNRCRHRPRLRKGGETGESNGVANCRGFGARRNGAQCLLDAVGKALERGARDGGCLHLSGGALACPRGVADPEKVHPHGPATNESPVDASTLSIAASIQQIPTLAITYDERVKSYF